MECRRHDIWRPYGTPPFYNIYPALKRWAEIFRLAARDSACRVDPTIGTAKEIAAYEAATWEEGSEVEDG